jgi:hypothetical protein
MARNMDMKHTISHPVVCLMWNQKVVQVLSIEDQFG